MPMPGTKIHTTYLEWGHGVSLLDECKPEFDVLGDTSTYHTSIQSLDVIVIIVRTPVKFRVYWKRERYHWQFRALQHSRDREHPFKSILLTNYL
jgi:hypothetical protein